jgi:hypothetical protein
VTALEGHPVILTEGSFVTPGGFQQEQPPGAELSDSSGKIVEFNSNTETNLEFLDTTTGTVEFKTQAVVTEQSQPSSGDAELLLNVVEPQTPQPIKVEDSTDIQPSTTKTLKVYTVVVVWTSTGCGMV